MKQKIKFTNYFLSLFIISSVFFAFNNPGNIKESKGQNNSASGKYFKMAEGLGQNDYLPNTVIFKLKEKNRNSARLNEIDNAVISSALNELGVFGVKKVFADAVKPVSDFSSDGEKTADLSLIYICKFNTSVSIEDAVNRIYNTGEVEYAQPKYIQQVSFTPNDPSLGSQYFLNKIQAPAGWDIQQGDTNVVIGIVDSGTDWDHPDLAANIKINYNDPINGIDDDNDGYVDNYRGWDLAGADYTNVVPDNDPMIMGSNNAHGSHVSGDASAVTNNGTGVAGAGFKCKIMGIKCAADNDTRGPGGLGLIITGYEGIKYGADMGCDIVNCSWGGGGGGPFEQDIITYATINKNTLVVCAAGNNSSSASFYPGAFKYVINIASTTSSDTKSGFSNYGNNIDACAPGSGIYSTVYNNSYATYDGTSMASPITAGVCGIVKSNFPGYTAIQVGEKVRVTSDNIDAVNPSYAGKLGKGRINMLRALTVNSPSVRLLTHTVTDGNNNVPQPNDTIRITGDFKNYLDPVNSVTASISTASGAVTIMNDASSLGAIPTLGNASNASSPFVVLINSNAAANTIVEFKISYSDGSYTDFEYLNVVVNPSYFNMNANNIETTINSRGNFGYNDYFTNSQGVGFKYNNMTSILYEGGLICATSDQKVSDCVRGSDQAVQSADFTSIIPFQLTEPGVVSNQDGNARYNDDGAGISKIGIEINFSSYEFNSAGDEDYVIMKYRIKNTTGSEITNFYAGLFGDWDVGTGGASNKADWDASNHLGYVWRADNNPGTYAGVALISASNSNYWAIDNEQNIAGNPWNIYDGFTNAEKYEALSSGVGRQQAGGSNGRDVSNLIGSGPYSIPSNGEIVIAFAILAGDNLADLQANTVAARNKYNTVLGITNFNSQIPEEYSLSQNYPNPFNPSTNIKFAISSPGFTSLKIYNMLGKEVSKLVSENLQAGSYEYNWDASAFTSGVYFYKLESDGFAETKRMLLV
ncbi:MAG TPA: S8 family serine peptidase, partial [Ignavibacteria bacterium]|nr:S8 family serine peptidase [Ignavibacteria bacterium]